MQHVLTQVPPNSLRSMIATFFPVPARRRAKEGPACPVPIMIASYEVLMAPPLQVSLTDRYQDTLPSANLLRVGSRLLTVECVMADTFPIGPALRVGSTFR